jgi:hypothetical protein
VSSAGGVSSRNYRQEYCKGVGENLWDPSTSKMAAPQSEAPLAAEVPVSAPEPLEGTALLREGGHADTGGRDADMGGGEADGDTDKGRRDAGAEGTGGEEGGCCQGVRQGGAWFRDWLAWLWKKILIILGGKIYPHYITAKWKMM